MEINWAAVMVAVLGGGGLGVAVREIVSVVTLARSGVSGKEDKRRGDIIAQRDHARLLQLDAEAGERAADARADRERLTRIAWQEHAALLRRRLIENGVDPDPEPVIDETTEPGRPRPSTT
jgi:hypothetical protein